MIGRFVRDAVNLLIYSGSFIGLCAACITAFSLELSGESGDQLRYIIFVGIATAGLYCLHRVIGLHKLAHLPDTGRFAVIRKYKSHLWVYCGAWLLASLWVFIPMASVDLIMWLIPGGVIGASYVIPLLPGGRRFRDLGWGKIMMIGWSWAWLTSFIPLWYFAHEPLQIAIIDGLERMLFIIIITIPFEIRDIDVDQSVGLVNVAAKFGKKTIIRWVTLGCIGIVFLSFVVSAHYFNPAYVVAMCLTCIPVIPMIKISYHVHDDLYYSGMIDGLMIVALWVFTIANVFL